jgi:hypothetical protein
LAVEGECEGEAREACAHDGDTSSWDGHDFEVLMLRAKEFKYAGFEVILKYLLL